MTYTIRGKLTQAEYVFECSPEMDGDGGELVSMKLPHHGQSFAVADFTPEHRRAAERDAAEDPTLYAAIVASGGSKDARAILVAVLHMRPRSSLTTYPPEVDTFMLLREADRIMFEAAIYFPGAKLGRGGM